jgi:Vacuolar protein sorting-associated protein 35
MVRNECAKHSQLKVVNGYWKFFLRKMVQRLRFYPVTLLGHWIKIISLQLPAVLEIYWQQIMSQFEGYMGGTPGQGYQGNGNGGSTNQSNQRDTQLSSHILGETQVFENYASVTQPYSMGSITQYYQPTILQSEAKSQFRTSNNPDYMVPNQTNFSSSSTLSHQILPVEQNFRPHLAPNIAQSTFPEHASNQVHNPISTNDFGNTSLNTQSGSTPIIQQSSFVAGSYAARSAQAYSVSGGISTYKQESSTLPTHPTSVPVEKYNEPPAVQAQQNRILADCTRRVQEHAYFMKQAMDKDDLSNVLDRASQMVGELSDSASGSLSPKNYYELHMRALDDMPSLEEYFLNLAASDSNAFTMKDLYEFVQYCPKVLSRLYLQISAGSALIRSKEESATTVLHDLIEAVKCVQNPLRGLFLRHFLLQVTRDRLHDGDNAHIAYEFILSNFIEMNHLWVRIQFSPGDGKTKEQRKRRERERNELRILVGTNLVRLSQLEGVTSKIYGEIILPKILEQVTTCGDPLAQAYLIDCIIQVFPDEYHIETLAILLAVCPRLKDKVNIRTIIQSLMDRLSNYFADKELLDEIDSNNVKRSLIPDSFKMFETCVERVYEARGPKLVPREIIRLQTALFNFSLKCFPENMEQLSRCLEVCNRLIRQVIITPANTNQSFSEMKVSFDLDEASKVELENMLSTPLNLMSIKVLQLNHYSDLLEFLPLENRREVGMTMLRAIDSSGEAPLSLDEIEKLFNIVLPVVSDDKSEDSENSNIEGKDKDKVAHEENILVSKLLHLLQQTCIDRTYDMLSLARSKLCGHCNIRNESILVPLVFEALQLANRILLGYRTAEGLIQETSTNSFSEGCANALEVSSESEFPYSENNAEDNRKVNASNDTYHENTEETSLIPK